MTNIKCILRSRGTDCSLCVVPYLYMREKWILLLEGESEGEREGGREGGEGGR